MTRTFACIALLLLVASVAPADELLECARLSTWGSRGSSGEILPVGNAAFVADGRGLAIYDITNPAAIRLLDAHSTVKPSRHLARVGEHTVVLTTEALELFGIKGGRLIRRSITPVQADHFSADRSFIATAATEVLLWQIAEDRPVSVRRIPLESHAESVLVAQGRLYVGEFERGVSVYDLSGTAIEKIGTIPVARANDMLIDGGGRLYVAAGRFGLQIFNVEDPANPILESILTVGIEDARLLALHGRRLALTDGDSQVILIDLDNPTAPRFISALDEPVNSIALQNDQLFLSGFIDEGSGEVSENGLPLRLFDISNPATPKLSGEFRDYAGPLAGVATDGAYAFVADPPMFRVVDIRTARPRQIASVALADSSDRVRLEGSRALVYGRGNVHMIDVSDPANPRYEGLYRSYGFPRSGAIMAGAFLLEANRATGFHVLDISDPASPLQISGQINDGYGAFIGAIAYAPTAAYALIAGGVKIIDMSNPDVTRWVRVLPIPSLVDAEVIAPRGEDRGKLLVANVDQLRIFDLADPLDPVEVSSIPIPASVDLAVDGSVAYLATREGALLRIDLSDPRQPRVTHTARTLSQPTQIAARGGKVVVADRYSLIVFRDFAAATAPLPEVHLTQSERSSATVASLRWTETGTKYELETSSNSQFSGATRTTGSLAEADVAVGIAPLFVRVRPIASCLESPWSNVLEVEAASAVSFDGTGRTFVLRRGSPAFTLSVALRNSSGQARSVSLSSSDGRISLPRSSEIPAGSKRLFEVTIDPASFPATTTIHLSANDSGRETVYAVQLLLVEATPTFPNPEAPRLVIPGIGSVDGGAGTKWRSELQLLCRGGPCPVDLRYFPFGPNPTARSVRFQLEESRMLVIEDVVAGLFGSDQSSGYLEIITTDLNRLAASAKTYNDGPAGRFGQRIPASRIAVANSPDHGIRKWITGARHDASFRTNIGWIETEGRVQALAFTAFSASGQNLAKRELLIPAGNARQMGFAELFPDLPGFEGGAIAVDGAGSFVVYSSRVDQKTGDGTFSYALRSGEELHPGSVPPMIRQIDVAGRTPGAAGSFWKTAVHLLNLAEESTLELTFLPAANPSLAVSSLVHLAERASFISEDVIADLFSQLSPEIAANGTLRVTSSSPFLGWGRVYNTTSTGTYGQFVPFRDISPARHAAEVTVRSSVFEKIGSTPNRIDGALFPLAESDSMRTNFGMVETAGKAVTVITRIVDSQGVILRSVATLLPPFGSRLDLGILRQYGLEGLEGLRAEVGFEGEGRAAVWASVVERATGDAVFIPAE